MRNYGLKQFSAAWSKFGKSAGVIRNVDTANYVEVLIAFWDGMIRGTGPVINLAEQKGLGI